MDERRVDVLTSPPRGVDFESFYDQEHLRLFRALLLATGDRAESEDLAHEAFVRLYERWDRVARMESPPAYLYATAWNVHRNRVRRTVRMARRAVVERGSIEDPSRDVLLRSELFRALSSLSIKEREAITLVDYLGFASHEAGAVLGVTAEAVRARVHRARERLRKELETDG